jgi:hypothetical protein
VCNRPSLRAGKPAMMGPVKFKQMLSPTAGLFYYMFESQPSSSYIITFLFVLFAGSQVCYRPSLRAGKLAMMGPVKFKQTLSPTAGLFFYMF